MTLKGKNSKKIPACLDYQRESDQPENGDFPADYILKAIN